MISIFKSKLLSFTCPVQSNVYNIFDLKGLRFLSRLGLSLSHLNEHRSRHNFQYCINPLRFCSMGIEDTSHYLQHCFHFNNQLIDLMSNVKSVCRNFESFSDKYKKMCFYTVTLTLVLMKTKIDLF